MLALMGMMMFDTRFARVELSRRRSLTARKSARASSSWQKTFTTFWPSIISSMKPSTSPRSCCCAAKQRPESAEHLVVTTSMMHTMATESAVNGTESRHMETNVVTSVTSSRR